MTCDTTLRIRLTRLAGRHSPPGSDAAIDAGCTCPVKDNARGAGLPGGLFWFGGCCPLHTPKDKTND